MNSPVPVPPDLRIPAEAAQALVDAHCGDPFALLGLHAAGSGFVLRVFLPGARRVTALLDRGEVALHPGQVEGLFVGALSRRTSYRLRIEWAQGVQETEDP